MLYTKYAPVVHSILLGRLPAVDADDVTQNVFLSAWGKLASLRDPAAIRAMPEAYRETLMMRLVEGLSGAEISERTGLTPGSVRVNLHRGMQLLREALS